MNHTAIARIFAVGVLGLAVAMVLPILVGLIRGEMEQVRAFLVASILAAMAGGSVLLLSRKPAKPAQAKDGLAIIVLFWIFMPIPAAIPFIFGVAETSLIAAYHEALSCLSTTGHSVISVENNNWPHALLTWRGILHLVGAWVTLMAVISVFAAMNLGGPGIHRTVFFTLPEGSFFDASGRVARAVSLLLVPLITLVFVGLLVSGLEPGDALSNAISIASTGLVLPQQTELPGVRGAGFLISFVGLLAASAGVAVLVDLRRGQRRAALVDPELVLLLVLVLIVTLIAWVGGLGGLQAAGWAVSALSTSGLSLGGTMSSQAETLPLSVLVLPALIGGSALSTAGGIKLARIFILTRRAMQEFSRLGFRHSVVGLKFRERTLDERTVIGIWVYLMAYIGAVTLFFAIFSFVGEGFGGAMRNAVGAITNSGWMIEAPLAHQDWRHLAIIAGMILGRLEVLAIVPALRPGFWRG